ncbi:reverse transcriptase domain-containing protein [Tanacetum coccineum]
MRSLGAVVSTIYSMIKFPMDQGVVTMKTRREALWECRHYCEQGTSLDRDLALDATNGSGWTNEAEKAFQKIKRKLNKLQTLPIPKEGEWAAKLRTYDISFIRKKEVERPVMKRFCKQGEQMLIVPDANDAETSELDVKLQAELTPTPRVWRLYLSREIIKEASSVGMILINTDVKTCSYAIRLNFNAPKHIMNYEALLAGLVASAKKGMQDLHVFVDSQILVDQVKGNRIPSTEQEKYMEEVMDATTPFIGSGSHIFLKT